MSPEELAARIEALTDACDDEECAIELMNTVMRLRYIGAFRTSPPEDIVELLDWFTEWTPPTAD
jgi:hypothetical protein